MKTLLRKWPYNRSALYSIYSMYVFTFLICLLMGCREEDKHVTLYPSFYEDRTQNSKWCTVYVYGESDPQNKAVRI